MTDRKEALEARRRQWLNEKMTNKYGMAKYADRVLALIAKETQ